ncbi:MAG: hypothetical protein QW416_03220 [Candidatus Nitrosocaldaceae archaeon]
MDPLILLTKAYEEGKIENRLYKNILERFRYVKDGITRIEKASKILYPEYYIEPALVTSRSNNEQGILFARTIPLVIDNRVRIVIEITAPLIIFGLKGTIHAILAHEFLHYLEFISRIIRMDIISDEISYTLFESKYLDTERLLDARTVFNDRALIRLLERKMNGELNDERLKRKSIELWLGKGYPIKIIQIEDNITRLPIDAIVNTPIDEGLESKIKDILTRMKTRRKKG